MLQSSVLVLVGAGASYGMGGHVTPGYPPLGKDLFDRLHTKYPSWTGLSTPLKSTFSYDFEKGMAALWDEHSGRTQVCLIDMARYFGRFLIRDLDNNYARLMRIICKDRQPAPILSSLNYETLFEQTVMANGTRLCLLGNPSQSLPPQAAHMIKPHGSSNYVIESGGIVGITLITSGGGGYADGRLIPIHNVQQHFAFGESIPSAMSMYTTGKPNVVGRTDILKQRKYLQDEIMRADIIVMVGVAPNMKDEHIFGFLSETRSEIFMLGGKSPGYAEFRRERRGRINYLSDTFADGLAPLALELPKLG